MLKENNRVMKKISFLSFCLVLFTIGLAQTPANDQGKRIMLYGATAHMGNGEVLENSLIVMENGKISSI